MTFFQPSRDWLQTMQFDERTDVTDFSIGMPGLDILPLDVLREASAHRLAIDSTRRYLIYGNASGDGYFRHALAQFLSDTTGAESRAESLFVTNGNSQALNMICTLFTHAGDTVFIEEPTYFLALQIFADHGLNVVSIPTDENGLRVDMVAEQLAHHRPKLIYTIPAFHNPTSVNLSPERRQQLLALSQQHDFLIVADEVYQLLHYHEPPPAPFSAFIDSGTVLSMGTFSKILAPGLRLGWIECSADLRRRFRDAGFVDSGGSLNHFTSGIVRSALELGLVHHYLDTVRAIYRQRIEVMDSAIRAYFPAEIRYQKPSGGYFFWLELPEHVEAVTVSDLAMLEKVGINPGRNFSAEAGLPHHFRLAFSFYPDDIITAGLAKLGRVLTQAVAK